MDNIKYVECTECGTVHYIVNEAEAKILDESDILYQEFSKRNLMCCSNCGSSNHFLDITDQYLSDYSYSDKIPPILLRDVEVKRTTKNGSE